ncbi:MAG: hypothetical protein IPK80_34595 [Nannocystis sp.]|nr:hypothetical protein [Nannocystis sp.]
MLSLVLGPKSGDLRVEIGLVGDNEVAADGGLAGALGHGLAAALILLLLILDFRGLRPALLAVVPTVVGWLWMLGLMAVLRIPFNIANIVCLPLVLGIGTAFGVHLMHCAQIEVWVSRVLYAKTAAEVVES